MKIVCFDDYKLGVLKDPTALVDITPVVREAAKYDLLDFVSREPSLEETFLAEYGREAAEAAPR